MKLILESDPLVLEDPFLLLWEAVRQKVWAAFPTTRTPSSLANYFVVIFPLYYWLSSTQLHYKKNIFENKNWVLNKEIKRGRLNCSELPPVSHAISTCCLKMKDIPQILMACQTYH